MGPAPSARGEATSPTPGRRDVSRSTDDDLMTSAATQAGHGWGPRRGDTTGHPAGPRRPDGRSARVRIRVLRATAALLAERGPAGVTVAEVAARAGVHRSSVHRRWGSPDGLLLDLATTRLAIRLPLPDTGSLRGDLLGYVRQASRNMTAPDILAFLTTVLAVMHGRAAETREAAPAPRDLLPEWAALAEGLPESDPMLPFLAARGAAIQRMLDRAGNRGEPTLSMQDVLDGLLAPVYLRRLLCLPPADDATLEALVDRVIDRPIVPPGHLQSPPQR